MATTVRAYCTAEGKPIDSTAGACSPAKRSCLGPMRSTVASRSRYSIKRKKSSEARLEMAVARPAPAAPMFRNCGSTKRGSSAMLSSEPKIMPALAAPARPSARVRLERRVLSTVGRAPATMT